MKILTKTTVCALALSLSITGIQAQEQACKGWPSRSGEIDIRSGFANPPKGYGNVPFYWWSGDKLDIERLNEQLDILADASTEGFAVSYNHTDARVDTVLNAQGHGYCGRVSGGEPRIMTDGWWKIWNEFSARCAEKGIGLGMDDYVIAWPKNGEFIDSVLALPSFKNYPGKLEQVKIAKGSAKPENTLLVSEAEDSLEVIYASTGSPELNPGYGKEVISHYFQQFEDHMDEAGRKGMNYFFQDECLYNPTILSWCPEMPEIFLKKKGYDILPLLPKLFIKEDSQIDALAAKVRMDYAEVVMDLAEEAYFKPIFEWNAGRGLIYGCDNMGRGLRPTQYVDYFRAISWFTAPGNDAPSRGSSFRQTKVSSSISHLYNRPRTWLEAFHSMGWDANGGVLTRQLDHHMIAGGNLLCMHGLYYSTHGGWWEWAPPCFHFRMPYWEHMKTWLKYAERMSFVLSQGTHVCDIAILYPTETMQAYPQANPDLMFKMALDLSDHGLDYDFIDYSSLKKASVEDARIKVSDESYKVLILADIRAMHAETLAKVQEFTDKGGIVLTVGGTMDGIRPTAEFADDCPEIAGTIRSRITPDFATTSGEGKVLHRRIGENDVYMIMDVPHGDEMTFRAGGKVEKWDAMHGTISELDITGMNFIDPENGCTTLKYDGEKENSMLIVFSPGQPSIAMSVTGRQAKVSRKRIKGEWDIEIIPTMNNRWGDFRLPASDELIGVEAREMSWCPGEGAKAKLDKANTSIYGYGPYMQTTTLDSLVNLDSFLDGEISTKGWQNYDFSWQYGVLDSPGGQGYHGLKSKVDDRFLILDQGGHQLFYTKLQVPSDGTYKLVKKGVEPYRVLIDGIAVADDDFQLTAGAHGMLIAYADTPEASYDFEKLICYTEDARARGMVMVYPAAAEVPEEHGMYDDIVSSCWFGTDFVPFDRLGYAECLYFFPTAPGTESMELAVHGTVSSVIVGGRKAGLKLVEDGAVKKYSCDLDASSSVDAVVVSGKPETGYPGAAFFADPVKMSCKGGRLAPGDWTKAGAMKFYSGGVKYSKTINVKGLNGSYELDLTEVDATCEVAVNGKFVDVLLTYPYKLDITGFLKEGDNLVEVLVYSSLANHYQTIPTPYRGKAHAGLIGPVYLNNF